MLAPSFAGRLVAALAEFRRSRLAAYKTPARWLFATAFPLT
jgi:hypothetical protein